MMNEFPWTIFFLLLIAGLLATAAVIPYALSFNPKALEKIKENSPDPGNPEGGKARRLPLPVLILISSLQSMLLIGVTTFLGLLTARQVGLGTPILQAFVEGGPVLEKVLSMLPASLLLGLAAGIILLVLEWNYFIPRIPSSLSHLDAQTALWKRSLACFYGGIGEEILMRLFLMSSLAWLLSLLWKLPTGAPVAGAFWLANILAALLFGAGHLPATSQVAALTPTVVARALLLNGIPGIVFGYLYIAYGLEAAMLSHFSLDILIHLIAPRFTRRLADSLSASEAVRAV